MTDMIRTKITTSFTDSKIVDLAMFDKKGRAIGVRVLFGTETRVADPSSNWLASPDTLGEYITLRVQPLRDGEAFGASQPRSLHKTRDDAEAAAEKKIAATSKRYTKQFAA